MIAPLRARVAQADEILVREHGRAGRNLGHLDARAVTFGDGDQPGAHFLGDLVALQVALVLVHQVDLKIAQFRAAAQEILAHQAVEVDRRRRAGVGDGEHGRALAALHGGAVLRDPLRRVGERQQIDDALMSGLTMKAGFTFRNRIPNSVRKETLTPDAMRGRALAVLMSSYYAVMGLSMAGAGIRYWPATARKLWLA